MDIPPIPGAEDVVTVMPLGAVVAIDPGAPELVMPVGEEVAPVIGVEVWAIAAAGRRASADAKSAVAAKRAIMLMLPSLPIGAGKNPLEFSYPAGAQIVDRADDS